MFILQIWNHCNIYRCINYNGSNHRRKNIVSIERNWMGSSICEYGDIRNREWRVFRWLRQIRFNWRGKDQCNWILKMSYDNIQSIQRLIRLSAVLKDLMTLEKKCRTIFLKIRTRSMLMTNEQYVLIPSIFSRDIFVATIEIRFSYCI